MDSLIEHREWGYLALTGSELGNGDSVLVPVVDGFAVALSVIEMVIVFVALCRDVLEDLFVVGIYLPAVSFGFNVSDE